MNNIYSLVNDIYSVVASKEVPEGVDLYDEIEQFGENCKRLMTNLFTEKRDGRTLRMSNIGRDDRYLWNVVNNPEVAEELTPNTHVKFMYGHLIEELLLFLTRLSGHEVTDEQKRCEVSGITGSMDCKIDGVVTDVKSVSTFGFKKFKDGSLAFDDPFGYVAQIKGYAHSEGGNSRFGWLAMDKQNGHLTYLMYDSEDTQAPVHAKIGYDIEDRIAHIKEVVQQEEPPEHCHELVADGKSGNMKLAVGCSYCPYKKVCWPNVRGFAYANGPRYLVEVVNEPQVQEIQIK
jgi:hypothetical protein